MLTFFFGLKYLKLSSKSDTSKAYGHPHQQSETQKYFDSVLHKTEKSSKPKPEDICHFLFTNS